MFKKLFNEADLIAKFTEMGREEVIVYGESYGGKEQGMSNTYGKEPKFIVFDVQIDNMWLNVPNADAVAKSLGLEFVHYVKISTDLAAIDAERDADSVQAKRNGILEPKKREGVVLRPLIELTKNDGERVICKHKGAEFAERKTVPEVSPEKQAVMENAKAIAEEWVTDMRLTHVLDKMGNPTELSMIPKVIEAMVEDVTREAAGEIVDNKETRKAIGLMAANLYKARVTKVKT